MLSYVLVSVVLGVKTIHIVDAVLIQALVRGTSALRTLGDGVSNFAAPEGWVIFGNVLV